MQNYLLRRREDHSVKATESGNETEGTDQMSHCALHLVLSLQSHSRRALGCCSFRTKKDCPCGQSLVVPWGGLLTGELDEQRGQFGTGDSFVGGLGVAGDAQGCQDAADETFVQLCILGIISLLLYGPAD